MNLYMRRKDRGRGLISVYDWVKVEEVGLFGYVQASNEWILKVVGEMSQVGEMKNKCKELRWRT